MGYKNVGEGASLSEDDSEEGGAGGYNTTSTSSRYTLSLKIQYETQFGQHMCVVGSIRQLGLWKDYIYDLQWTPGHYWVSRQPIVPEDDLF